jgi:hypothetical protein
MSLLQALNLPESPARTGRASATGARGRPSPAPAAAAKQARLSQAAAGWHAIHLQADERIEALKAAIKAHYAEAHPALLKEIERGVGKLDNVLDNVDQRLADLLLNASKAGSDAARAAELKDAKALLAQYIGYVKSEPLVAHIDRNPFGVKTDLRVLLVTALTDAAKAIG